MQITGSTLLITGGGSGIGRAGAHCSAKRSGAYDTFFKTMNGRVKAARAANAIA